MHKPSGKVLDNLIVKELELMLAQGYEKSPIRPKTLFDRLKKKEIILGSISTLTSRRDIINLYAGKQLEKEGVSLKLGRNKKSTSPVDYYRMRYNDKKNELAETIAILNSNTWLIIDLIKEVEQKCSINIENLLTPYLVEKIHEKYDSD